MVALTVSGGNERLRKRQIATAGNKQLNCSYCVNCSYCIYFIVCGTVLTILKSITQSNAYR